jgi:hypothetical protein
MTLARWSPVVLAGTMLAVFGRAEERSGSQPDRSAQQAHLTEFRGSGSCSAVACHGSIRSKVARGVLRNEHTTWISDDRHSRAYETLFDARSERIERSLAADPGQCTPAFEDARCLACHTTPRSQTLLAATKWINQDGVGCESCHGASGSWLGPHTTSSWQQNDAIQKEKLGLINNTNLARRAGVCAGCHVGGSPRTGLLARDVNHDLIAAGHPRLNFEFTAYLTNMPPHWNEKDRNADAVEPGQPAADFAARAWAVGQIVTLRESLELLRFRSVATGKRAAPWPEFTEYGCFSCHHGLRDDPWRRRPAPGGTVPGAPVWGSWTTPLVRDLFDQLVAGPEGRRATESLGRLAVEMARPTPAPLVVERESSQAAQQLGRCLVELDRIRIDAGNVERLIRALDRPSAWEHLASWDEAALRYLALVPLRQAWARLDPAPNEGRQQLEARLKELRSRLMFPSGFDSPRGFDPSKLLLGR